MNVSILIATCLVELVIGVLGFISMHLRKSAERRRLTRLPTWLDVPFSFKTDYYANSDDKVGKTSEFMKPRSRRV